MYQHHFRQAPRAPIFEGRTECGHVEDGSICIADELSAWHTPGVQDVDRPLWDLWVRRGFHHDDGNGSVWTHLQLRSLMRDVYELGKKQSKARKNSSGD